MVASNDAVSYLKRAEKRGRRFLNPTPTQVGGFSTVFKVLPQYLKNKAQMEPAGPLGPFRTDASLYATLPASGLRVTWFGHSASLIEIDGKRVLVDPVWEERASPFPFMGPKRFFQPTLALENLPMIDVVLISHDHYDHMGADTIGRLARLEAAAGGAMGDVAGGGQVAARIWRPRRADFGARLDRECGDGWPEGDCMASATLLGAGIV